MESNDVRAESTEAIEIGDDSHSVPSGLSFAYQICNIAPTQLGVGCMKTDLAY